MGKGDKKSKRGKIIMGSTGVSRQKKKTPYIPEPKAVKPVEDKALTEKPAVEAVEKPAKKKTTVKAKATPKKAEKPVEEKAIVEIPAEEKPEAGE